MLENFFHLKQYGSNVRTEILAGATTFIAAMYIIVVNPAIVSKTGLPFNAILTGTVILSAFCSIMMGIYANNPILVAPAMGTNVFFTYSVVIGMNVKPEIALGSLFWAGVVFFFLSIFKIRAHIVKSIPKQLRYALASGIGFFIALIGFNNGNFIVPNPPLIGFTGINAINITFIIGLLITASLITMRVKGSFIIGILITTLLCIPIGRLYGDASAINNGVKTLVSWNGLFSHPDTSLLFKIDLLGSLHYSLWPVIFTIFFCDLFDSLSTVVGVAEAAKLFDEKGEPRNINQTLVVDSVATGMAGLLYTTSGTAYIESAAGVMQGGRTGLTAVVCGILFLPFLFLSPLLSVVPLAATAPALILVGVFMMKPVLQINWLAPDDAIPAFLSILLIPLTYSITEGIIWGLISFTFLKLLLKKYNEISVTLIIIDILAIILLFLR